MKNQIYVWDVLVRFFHWMLVLTFIIAYLSGEELDTLHAYAGYLILGLIGVRVIWGLIGSRYARFSQFMTSPGTAIEYLKNLLSSKPERKDYIGHNPAGGWMIIALLVSILATGFSGLKVYGLEGHGPLALADNGILPQQQGQRIMVASDDDHEDSAEEEFWEETHELLANFMVLLIALHIAGVFLSSIKHRENLVKAMMSGYKER